MSGADRYFAVWGTVLPIASVVLIPFVQGTTPGYVMALALLLPAVNVLILTPDQSKVFYIDIVRLIVAYVALLAICQLALSYSGIRSFPDARTFGSLTLVDPTDSRVLLRSTMFSQSFYLLAGACTFVFVKRFYDQRWDRYLMYGVVLLALYGIYEVCFFAIFHQSGDVLTNRRFGGGLASGSLFQTMTLGPLRLQRLKSLTGEPSMYAFSVLPYWIYAAHTNRRWTYLLLSTSLLLTTSSTAALGIALYLGMRFLRFGVKDRLVALAIVALLIVVCLGLAGNGIVVHAYEKVVASRLSLNDMSSISRWASFRRSMDYFLQTPLLNQLFGLGFGYARETNMFTTLLVNLGIIGFALTVLIFAFPIFGLGRDERSRGIQAGLIVLLVTMMVSVPEYGYLPVWLFLGIGYSEFNRQRRASEAGMPGRGIWKSRTSTVGEVRDGT